MESAELHTKEGVQTTFLKEYQKAIERLQELYPKAFPSTGYVVLKRSIDLDICKDGKLNISRSKLRSVLKRYTSGTGYINAYKAGAERVDLKGNMTEEVLDVDVESIKKLKVLKDKRRQFLKAQRDKIKAREIEGKDL